MFASLLVVIDVEIDGFSVSKFWFTHTIELLGEVMSLKHFTLPIGFDEDWPGIVSFYAAFNFVGKHQAVSSQVEYTLKFKTKGL